MCFVPQLAGFPGKREEDRTGAVPATPAAFGRKSILAISGGGGGYPLSNRATVGFRVSTIRFGCTHSTEANGQR